MMRADKILFATDYSKSSDFALELAGRVARSSGGQLLIVHVSERELYPVGERFDEPPQPHPDELARLHAVVPPEEGVQYEHHLLYREPAPQLTQPAEVILRAAEEHEVDMIVMGTHGHSGLSRAMLGSVAESVMRKAHCVVVVVKSPAEE